MPLLTTPDHLDRFARRAASSISDGARVLDAGAGDSPYRKYFTGASYEAADICLRDAHKYSHVQHVCDLTAIPVEDGRFDLVLCTQVLEHVSQPQKVLHELWRVLKPGAHLWISAPLFFEEHEIPHDYFRFTQYGWRHLMTTARFEIVELEWLQGYLGTVSHQLNLARHFLPSSPSHYGGGLVGGLASVVAAAAKPALLGLAWLFSRLDLRHRYVGAGYPLDYCLVARKSLDT